MEEEITNTDHLDPFNVQLMRLLIQMRYQAQSTVAMITALESGDKEAYQMYRDLFSRADQTMGNKIADLLGVLDQDNG